MRPDYCPLVNEPCQSLCDTPCKKRKWVYLTDVEIARVVSLAGFNPDWVEAKIATQIVRVLEKTIKEKNK